MNPLHEVYQAPELRQKLRRRIARELFGSLVNADRTPRHYTKCVLEVLI